MNSMTLFENAEVNRSSELERQILHIEKRFDWDGVRQLMVCMGWRWGVDETPPSIENLKKTARCLLQEAWQNHPGESFSMISTGGFNAARINGVLELWFGFKGCKMNFDWESLHTGEYRNWVI